MRYCLLHAGLLVPALRLTLVVLTSCVGCFAAVPSIAGFICAMPYCAVSLYIAVCWFWFFWFFYFSFLAFPSFPLLRYLFAIIVLFRSFITFLQPAAHMCRLPHAALHLLSFTHLLSFIFYYLLYT